MKNILIILVLAFSSCNSKHSMDGGWVINPEESSKKDYIEMFISNKTACFNETHLAEVKTSFKVTGRHMIFDDRKYVYKKINEDKILLNFKEEKLIFDRDKSYCSCESFTLRWVRFLKKYELADEESINEIINIWLRKE